MEFEMKTKGIWCKFWVKSSRGTNNSEYHYVEVYGDKEAAAKDSLDHWYEKRYGHLEFASCGYQIVRRPPKAAQDLLLKQAASRINDARTRLRFLQAQFK